MPVRNAEARWQGTLKGGTGQVKLGSGAFEGSYSFSSRFEDATGTNPEELLGAAHAACYSLALSAGLERAGFTVNYVHTTARVHLNRIDDKMQINQIDLIVEAEVPGVDEDKFMEMAEATKSGCIISVALSAVPMTVEATLKS